MSPSHDVPGWVKPQVAQPLGGRCVGRGLPSRRVGVWETLAQEAGPAVWAGRFWPEAQAGPTAPPAGLPV